MIFENRKVKIAINNQDYSFYYSYNDDNTFSDLLEFFSSLVPSLKLCECYYFQSHSKDKKDENKYTNISYNSKIIKYLDSLDNLILRRNKDECTHFYKNLLYESKQNIISYFKQQILEKNKEIEKQSKLNSDLSNNNNSLFNHLVDKTPINDYDIIVHIDSIKDINKGWKIEMNERGKQIYEKYKNSNTLKIGVIGNGSKSKSFILSKISKMSIPSEMGTKVEGLKIKYPDLEQYNNRCIVYFNSSEFERPALLSQGKSDEEKDKLFKEKCRDKIIVKLFMENYIIHNSNILIVVVDTLSFSEQKLIMKVKNEIKISKKPINLIIIHNLKEFTFISQIQDYIDKTLFKSSSFNLIKGFNMNSSIEPRNETFFFEERDYNNRINIFHLIYANEYSEAGKYYNQSTLNFVENIYKNVNNLKPFDLSQSIKERFIELSGDIIEQTENKVEITKENFDDSDSNLIKLNYTNEIIFKACLFNEFGRINLKSNSYEPAYNIYKKDNKIIIRVEISGNFNITAERLLNGAFIIIRLKGEKKRDLEPENLDDNIYNTRKFGKFALDIPLIAENYYLKREKPKIISKKGLIIIEYEFDNYGCSGWLDNELI